MEFNLKKTEIHSSLKIERFFLFRYSKFLRDVSLFLFFLFLFIYILSLLGFSSEYFAFKMVILSLSFYFLFLEIYLFIESKVKKIKTGADFEDVISNIGNYNLAEFLSFDCAEIIEDSIKFCKRRNIAVNSTAVLYSLVKMSKDIGLVFYRLGLDNKKLKDSLKNYLEKMERSGSAEVMFSEDFENTVKDAFRLSAQRGHSVIDEREILAGIAKNDIFLKEVLMEYELKEADIENLTLWLESAKDALERSKRFWLPENLARRGSLGKDWASGYTITLDKFSVDWRKITSKWDFKEIIGHEKEISQAETVLAKSDTTNVLIVGDPGTGRKSIIEALAQKCYLGKTLPELKNKRVVELDMVSLTASIQNFEKLESTLDEIFQEVLIAGNVILAIDDLENFVGQKSQRPGAVDISAILAKYLAITKFPFIGVTTYDGLHKNIEENQSFANLFRKIEIIDITESETIRILQNMALEIENRNKILILYPTIREIVNLTSRYMPSRPFPEKAIDILEETAVFAQMQKEKIVRPYHVAKVISEKTEIPVGKMEVKEKEVLLNLENLIHNRIVNQEEAVKEVSIAMRRARSGIGSKTRPMGSFLFMGPTGVGKTETAKALAQIYFGSEEKMIRLDMSEFQAVSDIPRLIGSVSPVEMQGVLTTPVRENPFSLILLDEIEKSYPDILNLFLQVFDEGHITDGQGRKVSFNNAIIICTSNAGASMIFKEVEAGRNIDKQKFLDALIEKNIFKPEFLNRFDAAVIFHPLTKDNLLKIAQLFLKSLQKNLKEKEIDFEITEPLKEKIVELSYKPEFGAREMRRVIQDKIENTVAEALISEKIKKGDTLEINPETFELIVNPSDNI